jgi:uncharacterized membrane-anchored protein
MIRVNITPMEALNPYTWLYDEGISNRVRAWLFTALAIAFGSMGAAIWIMAAIFMPPNNNGTQWPGIALLIQTMAIFMSSLIILWCKQREEDAENQGLL